MHLYSGKRLPVPYDLLRDEYDIQIELGDIANILAYISIGDRIQDIAVSYTHLDVYKRQGSSRSCFFVRRGRYSGSYSFCYNI